MIGYDMVCVCGDKYADQIILDSSFMVFVLHSVLPNGKDTVFGLNSINQTMNLLVLTERTAVYIEVENSFTNWTVNVSNSIIISMNGSNQSAIFNLYPAFTSPATSLMRLTGNTWNFMWTPLDTSAVNFTYEISINT